jgi:hypothetical protein
MRTSQKTPEITITIGLDLGKNTFHLVGLDKRFAIVLQQKVSRGQLERRLANVPRCLIGMEPCSGSHHRPPGGAWSRRASDPGPVRETVPQGSHERLSRCRGDRALHQHRDRPLQRTSLKPNPPARPASGCLRIAFLGAGLFSSADALAAAVAGRSLTAPSQSQLSTSVISGARAVGADEHRAPADLTSFPAFGFRPVPDIGVLFGAFEEFIARIALQDVSAFLKINHAIAARQESARPRLKSYLKHVILLLADEGSAFRVGA